MRIEGKVENFNIGNGYCNFNIITEDKKHYNIKMTKEQSDDIKLEKIYLFEVELEVVNDRPVYTLISATDLIDSIDDEILLKEKLLKFYPSSNISAEEIKDSIESYLNKVENKILKEITTNIYNKYRKKFYLYPAAVRFHHAYIGGLSEHTMNMLKLAEAILEIYDFINKDLVYSGIILHDITKIVELSGVEASEYTKEGQLIGHLVLGSYEVNEQATKLGYIDSEEVLMLNHILLSHHGLPNFGAARRPQTAEALLVWYIDTIDSKFEVIKQELEKTDKGTFTNNIAVADKAKIYKHTIE